MVYPGLSSVHCLSCKVFGRLNHGLQAVLLHLLLVYIFHSIAESAGEEFAKKLDGGHRINCPWRGNICAESLVQFPPTPPSALVGGYKDRCDGLLQFLSLPIVAASAIEQMKASRSPELERFLDQLQDLTVGDSGLKADVLPQTEANREEVSSVYTHVRLHMKN